MSSFPKHFYTIEEYAAVERVGVARYEYWDGDIVCMSGGSQVHGRITGNVYAELHAPLKKRACTPFNTEIPIKTPMLPPYRYPDASVACGNPVFEKFLGIDLLTNPVLVVEVLSPHTEAVDRKEKFEAYKAIETVREYLLIAQNAPLITHYVKQENNEWKRFDTADLTATLTLNAIDCTLAVSDVYAGVEFQ